MGRINHQQWVRKCLFQSWFALETLNMSISRKPQNRNTPVLQSVVLHHQVSENVSDLRSQRLRQWERESVGSMTHLAPSKYRCHRLHHHETNSLRQTGAPPFQHSNNRNDLYKCTSSKKSCECWCLPSGDAHRLLVSVNPTSPTPN